ncbi:MAG: histidine kinase [Flavobacteriales bacterium]|nr:histidine kinase [Flavobacteriales bacterium]
MTNKKWIYWTLQIFGWGSVLSISLIIQYLETGKMPPSKNFGESFAFLLLIILSTHLYRLTIIRLKWLDKKLNQVVPFIILGSLVLAAILLTMNMAVDMSFGEKPYTGADILNGLFSLFVFSMIWSVFYFSFHFFDKSRKQEVKNLQLESTQKETELMNLKNQLKPHFMFNAMNSIRALVDEDPVLAKQSITQLSNLLRNTLQFGQKKLITLKEEMQIVNDYLALEKIRFEERLDYQQEIDEGLLQQMLPPLIIQTLIENAIKHGVSKKTEGGLVSLKIYKEEFLIKIEIRNVGKYDPSATTNSGIGLENAKKRLQILYGVNADFSIENEQDHVLTCISVPLNKN